MAADQLNKRPNGTNVVDPSRKQYKVKKKKMESPPYDLNMRSNISLEWDDRKKSVVAKRDQIGIARRELIPFLNTVPRNVLGDVFEAPREIFELDSLDGVLSYEVWQTCLSDKERKFLIQFLPKGFEGDTVVQDLLAGKNCYFGNLLLKWGASLCSGNCHPDAIVLKEQSSNANKKAYYSELQKYHTNMIGSLQTWKERWETCKNSEHEFMQKIWRSRKDYEKSGSTSESCSWSADEKACSSDNPTLTTPQPETLKRKGFMESKYDESSDGHKARKKLRKGDKLHKRNIECGDGAEYMSYIKVSKEQHQRVKSSMKHPTSSIQSRSLNNVLGNLDTFCVQPYEVFEKEEKQKLHIYWLQLVKKDLPAGFKNWRKWQSEKSQLTHFLGQELKEKVKHLDKDEKEEKIHAMLLQQTNNEPSNLEPDNEASSFKPDNEAPYLKPDNEASNLKPDNEASNLKPDNEASNLKPDNEASNLKPDNEASNPGPISLLEDEEREQSDDSSLHEQIADGERDNEASAASEVSLEESGDSVFKCEADTEAANHELAVEFDHEDKSGHDSSPQDMHIQQISLLNGNHDCCSMEADTNNDNILTKPDCFPPPNVSPYGDNMNHIDLPVGQADPLSSASEVWPAVGLASSYYHRSTPVSHEYASTSELLLGNAQVRQDHGTQVIDLESEMQEQVRGREYLQRQSAGTDEPFFTPYTIQDRNLMLQSLVKNPGSSPYHHPEQHKMTARLDFPPTSRDLMLETSHFTGNLRDSSMGMELMPLEMGHQKRLNDLYVHHNIQNSMFAVDGGVSRYSSTSRQEHFTPLNHIQDWAINNASNAINMPPPSSSHSHPHSHLNGGGDLVNENWFSSGEHRALDGWPVMEGAVGSNPASIASSSNVADQSLFSVLSECNGMKSGAHYDSAFGNVQPGISYTTGNVVPTRTAIGPTALNYLSGNESSSSGGLRTNNSTGWMGVVPHQNGSLQDTLGKPFLRSWNQ